MYDCLLFDFNGTLLNDLERGFFCIQSLCDEYQVKRPDLNHYLESFGFPVHDFYNDLGFNLNAEEYSQLSKRFMEIYHTEPLPSLFHCVPKILESLKEQGYILGVVSAYRQDRLIKLLDYHGIIEYFTIVAGLEDDLASSKEARLQYALDQIKPQKALFIGDTLHDLEVAESGSIDCHLISAGHYSHDRLAREAPEVPLFGNFEEWYHSLKLAPQLRDKKNFIS